MKNQLRSYINDISCERYRAELFHHNIAPCEVLIFDEWLNDSLDPIEKSESVFRYSSIVLVYFVEGRNETETITNVSKLVQAHKKCKIKFEHTNFYYKCKLSSSENIRISGCDYKVTITLQSSYKYKDKIFKLINTPIEKLVNKGNLDTPINFKIVAIANIEMLELKVNDEVVVFKGLIKDDVVEFLSEDFSVKKNGAENWGFVEFWDILKLKSGINTIEFNSDKLIVNIDYIPRFV